ncbi:MAG: hypothetical protein HZA94_03645 [Candidatus Vogelbacteria bacterium]|nr:hypothetical protein [Candidatus Vogelbacteria bacterium]
MKFRQDKTKSKDGVKYFLLIFLVGLVFYFGLSFLRETTYAVLSFIGRPLWTIASQVNIKKSEIYASVAYKRSLETDNLRLRAENDNLKLLTLSLPVLQTENIELKRILGREDNGSSTSGVLSRAALVGGSRFVLANVLSGPVVPPYSSLILDVGEDQNISPGDKIIAGPNVVLGEVIEVSRLSSRAVLYSSYGTETEVIINAEIPIRAIAVGYGGGNFYVEIENSTVVTSGMAANIPGKEGYVLGIAEFVKKNESSASQKILFRYPINPSQVKFVRVSKNL